LTIRQLSEQLTNKIAAGEVVERPSSVVKELVENSIDAHSTHIKIEIEEAGLKTIKVIDNGTGMNEADSKRSFLRHATSKIRYDADLFRIQSLGFRGEALASIASVSKVTLKTSTGEEAGTILYLEAGEIVRETKGDARKGTEITVEQLFYNTPARLKYVKSIHTELGHITDLVNRYALAHPSIRFELMHNGKRIFHTSGSNNLLQVIANIYGRQVAEKMLHFSGESLDFQMDGYVAKPEVTRANRNYISCFVNGRYIRNHAITHAILRAYDTLLPIHRFPIVILNLQLDPILVDVNVHPTKLEVRFSKEQELTTLVEKTIRETFQQHVLIPSIKQTRTITRAKERPTQEAFSFTERTTDQQARQQGGMRNEEDRSFKRSHLKNEALYNNGSEHVHESHESITSNDNEQDAQITFEAERVVNEERKGATTKELGRHVDNIPPLYPIGQLQGTYILAQNENGFYMIDQHAAQERIKYEYYKRKLKEPETALQQLLMPLIFEFTYDEAIYIERHKDILSAIGIELEPFGTNTYAIRACPDWIPKGLEETFVRDIINQVVEMQTIDIGKLREEMAITMSCKRSIKANHRLTESEMARLLDDLRLTVDPYTCPHGRPVIIHFTYYEIEKMFKRIM